MLLGYENDKPLTEADHSKRDFYRMKVDFNNDNYFQQPVEEDKEDVMDALLKENIFENMCNELGQDDCKQNAMVIFKSWIKETDPDKSNLIPLSMRSATYCTAIQTGGEEEWNFLWERYKTTTDANEKSNILKALGCSQKLWILQVNIFPQALTPKNLYHLSLNIVYCQF